MKATLAALWVLTSVWVFALGCREPRESGGSESRVQEEVSFLEALQDPNLLTRSYHLSGALQGLNSENLEAYREVLIRHQNGLEDYEIRIFMFAWARFDAPGAFEWALREPEIQQRTFVNAAAYAWGFLDPQRARRSLDKSSESALAKVGLDRKTLRAELVEGWIRSSDKQGVTDYVASLAVSDKGRKRFISMIAGEMRKQGPEAVIRWAETVFENASKLFKKEVFSSAVYILAHRDFDEVKDWYRAHMDQPYASAALGSLIRPWVKRSDPSGLFDWVQQLPEDSVSSKDVKNGIEIWYRDEREEAVSYVDSTTLPATFDLALAFVANEEAPTHPGAATRLAHKIKDEKRRTEVMMPIAKLWLNEKTKPATAWLTANGLLDTVENWKGRAASRKPPLPAAAPKSNPMMRRPGGS